MIKNILVSAITSTLIVSVFLFGGGLRLGTGSGNTHFFAEEFLNTVTFTGGTTFNGEPTLGTCGTKSFTIPALSPRTSIAAAGAPYTSTTVSLSGAALGDIAIVSNNSTTQALSEYGIITSAVVSSANTSTVLFFNTTGVTSTAVTTGTLRVCYFD